jgi:integrase
LPKPQHDADRVALQPRLFFASAQLAESERSKISGRFHDLRRTFGLLMLEAGVGIDQVSRVLGHVDLAVTTGGVDSLQEDAAERLDALLRYGPRRGAARNAV